MAVAVEQEMIADIERSRSKVVEAEAEATQGHLPKHFSQWSTRDYATKPQTAEMCRPTPTCAKRFPGIPVSK